MKRVFHGLAHRRVDSIGHQRVQTGTLIDLVEVRNCFALEECAFACSIFYGWSIPVIERSLDQIAGGQQVLEPLLVLDADAVAFEIVGDPNRRNIHLALLKDLLFREVGSMMGTDMKDHALLVHPISYALCLRICNSCRFVIERRLAKPFLVDAGGVQEVVGNDRVEHPHATFVEYSHDRLVGSQLRR